MRVELRPGDADKWLALRLDGPCAHPRRSSTFPLTLPPPQPQPHLHRCPGSATRCRYRKLFFPEELVLLSSL